MKEDNQPFLLFLEGERERGSYGGRGKAWAGPTYPDRTSFCFGTGAVERFHIAEPKGSTSVRDRSMSRPRSIEKYLFTISGSLIRKTELGWGSTM